MALKTLSNIGVIRGQRVLVRLDLNVPVEGDKVEDDFRIRQALPTLAFLRERGAKIIAISHIETVDAPTLKPVFERMSKSVPMQFVADPFVANVFDGLKEGEVALVENIRNWPGEKANDADFAKQLASLADLYVNEAFSVSHRAHASIVGVPKLLPSFAGLRFVEEVRSLSEAFHPAHPYLFLLGGAKFETKISLITKFLALSDNVFVGGALANDLFKAKGYEMGQSVVSETKFDFASILADKKLILPIDVVTVSGMVREKKPPEAILPTDVIFDAGPETLAMLAPLIANAKTILWNGPIGWYEKGYTEGTQGLASLIAESSAHTILGGGDTLAAIKHLGIETQISFISTGGGAMLDFLANETLPGIEALENSKE